MTLAFRIATGCWIAVFWAAFALAQALDAPPKDTNKAKPAATRDAKSTEPADAKPADVPPENPAVTALLETKPATPLDCLRTAKVLIEFDREDLAKSFLKKAMDAKLEPPQLIALGEQLSTATILDFASRPKLQPEGKQLADAVMAAIEARQKDSRRIDGLVRQLQDPSPEKRVEAVVGLQESRDAAINPLVQVLADPARAVEHANVRAALVELGRIVRGPLTAIVEQGDPKLAVQAIEVLGTLQDARIDLCLLTPCWSEKNEPAMREAAAAALKRLTGRVATRDEAVWLLTDAARGFFERHNLGENDAGRQLWHWDAVNRLCTATVCTPETIARARAARFAADAYVLSPDDPRVRTLYLATMLEAASYDNGLDRPLDAKHPAVVEATRYGVKMVEELLRYSMAYDHPAAAAAASRILGQIGKAEELLYQDATVTPLVAAVQSRHRRLRLAAVEAIVRLQPTNPFAGASYIPRALGFFAASRGARSVLVACPNLADVQNMAGMLAAAGYEAEVSTSGRELLIQASRSPDCELAIIDAAIARPEIGALLQQLRHDPRTAQLRVAIVARSGYFAKAEREANLDPLSKAFARPHDQKVFDWQLNQLTALAPEDFVSFQTRQQQAAAALDLLADITRSPSRFYDIRGVEESLLTALYNPKLSEKASIVLATVNSPDVQRALVEVASRFTLPLRMRQAAAGAFRINTQKHGILLTTDEISRQYRRYNESEKQDRGTQRVLGQILDCLEINVPKKTN
jgi:CheY-like chemotaxis protein